MPSLAEIKQKRLKKFIKKSYRSWDLSGEINTKTSSLHPVPLLISSKHTTKQLDNKQTSDRQQIDNGQTIERQRTDNHWTTNSQQPGNTQTTHKTTTKTTIGQQLEDLKIISDEVLTNTIKALSGLQEKIFFLIIEYCNLNNDIQTGQLKTAKLATLVGCSYRCVKIIIERVIKKNIIKRLKGKSSIAGFVQFEISKEVKTIGNRLVFQKRNIDREFNEFITIIRQQVGQQLDIRLDNNNSTSSSNILNTTTTNGSENSKIANLSNEWLNVDIEPLSSIGFDWSHLSQIANQNKLTTKLVQDSVYAFAFDLQENNKEKHIKKDPLNYFMGILCAGRIYNFSGNYESPQDKALRMYRERMNKIEQGRVEAEKEAKKLAFNEWLLTLTNEQKKDFLPLNLRNGAKLENSMMLDGYAWNKFENEIWPQKKNEILQQANEAQSREVTTIEEQK